MAVQRSPREGWSAEEPSPVVQVICAKVSVSRHRHLHPSLLIDLTHLIVCTLMGTSLSKAPDSEVIRAGGQSFPRVARECGAPDHFSIPSSLPLSHLPLIHEEQLQDSLAARREDRQTAVTL